MLRRNNNVNYSLMILKVNNWYRNLFILSILFLCASNVFAGEAPNLAKPKIVVPERIAGVSTVSAEQVIEALSSDKPQILIDARIKDHHRVCSLKWHHRLLA